MSLSRLGSDRLERREMALLTPLPVRVGRTAEDANGRDSDPVLTPRQRQVVDGLVRGLTNKEIAAELGVGPDAVKRTISRLLVKLHAPSRTALVEIALRTSAARVRRSRGPKPLTLLDAAPIPVLLSRGDRHAIDFANAAARAILGIDEVGARLIDVLPAPARSAVRIIADASAATGLRQVAKGVALGLGSDENGSWRYADVFASPVLDGAGDLAGLVLFFIDSSHSRDGVATR